MELPLDEQQVSHAFNQLVVFIAHANPHPPVAWSELVAIHISESNMSAG